MPEGPFIDVHNGPMFDFGYAAIDGHVFIDDDGTKYFYHVGFNDGNRIYVAKLSDDLLSITEECGELIKAEEPWETVDCLVAEGPFVLKKKGI